MGKIIVSDNVTLDGVIQDPAGDEGFRLGGWVGRIKDRTEVNKRICRCCFSFRSYDARLEDGTV